MEGYMGEELHGFTLAEQDGWVYIEPSSPAGTWKHFSFFLQPGKTAGSQTENVCICQRMHTHE